jgi:Domain of unknown function (DUF4173)
MTSPAVPSVQTAIPHPITGTRIGAAIALVLIADVLFFNRAPGLSILIFLLALSFAALVCNPISASRRMMAVASGILVLSSLPLIEDCSPLSVLFAALGAAAFVRLMTVGLPGPILSKILRSARLCLAGPTRLIEDLAAPANGRLPATSAEAMAARVLVWVLPVGLGLVFLGLFASANPVLESALAAIDLKAILAHVDGLRIMFWGAVVVAVWPFVSVRVRALVGQPAASGEPAGDSLWQSSHVFGEAAILRCLIVFNALFAMQTAMDIGFLSGGVALPAGMSYAAYAHRGAYPLMVTALLAGAFVIATMRPTRDGTRSRLMTGLVLAWIAQNIALVLSSILRLDLYVEAYSLTTWRLAAFIWMGLVAAGLVLLILRIALRWSNQWMVSANVGMLTAVLYACCFLNSPDVVASYNVRQELPGGLACRVDTGYLASLGPEVVPAVAW